MDRDMLLRHRTLLLDTVRHIDTDLEHDPPFGDAEAYLDIADMFRDCILELTLITRELLKDEQIHSSSPE